MKSENSKVLVDRPSGHATTTNPNMGMRHQPSGSNTYAYQWMVSAHQPHKTVRKQLSLLNIGRVDNTGVDTEVDLVAA